MARCTWAGRWCLKVGEKRRPAIDFAALDELESESLTGTPTVAAPGESGGIIITLPAVDGTEVSFWADATDAVVQEADAEQGYSDYEFEVSVGTSGGAILVRSGTIRIEE